MESNIIIAGGTYSRLVNRIVGEVGVRFKEVDKYINCEVVWDTGATHSIILPTMIKKYSLVEFNKIEHPYLKGETLKQFKVDLCFTNNLNKIYFQNFILTEWDFNWKEHIVIGMDIIKLGFFYVSMKENKTNYGFSISEEMIRKINAKEISCCSFKINY